jgi:hypothetical protein
MILTRVIYTVDFEFMNVFMRVCMKRVFNMRVYTGTI